MMEKELLPYEKKHLEMLRPFLSECTVLLKHESSFRVDKPCSVALYGNGIRHTQKGGTGSGDVNSHFLENVEEAFLREGFAVTTKGWLDAYDKILPAARKAFGKKIRKEAKAHHENYLLYGMGMVMDEPEWDIPMEEKGDLAVYVLGRVSGEGNDRKYAKGDFLLTDSEVKAILSLNEKFERFLLVLNVGGPVDLTPVLKVRNILLLSQLGVETASVLVDIVLKRSYPSGKLSTTWGRVEDDPTQGHFAAWEDTEYREGIYVGYRYYDSTSRLPVFPFGYGLSFTSFLVEKVETHVEKTKVSVSASIRNVGKEEGKETLQLYVSFPSEKLLQPFQSLVGFQKTKALSPGESDLVDISFDMKDLASYSESDGAYLLEKGEYILRLGTSSRETSVISTISLVDEAIVKRVRKLFEIKPFEELELSNRKYERVETVPNFQMDSFFFDCVEVSYEENATQTDPLLSTLSEEELAMLSVGGYKDGNSLESIIGEASTKLCGAAGETSGRLGAKGLPVLVMADGPAGLRLSKDYWVGKKGFKVVGGSLFPKERDLMDPFTRLALRILDGKPGKQDEVHHFYCTAIPIGTALAQSFNLEFASLCGDMVAEEMTQFGVDLWLAPALNIQRSVLCGRNFEYYSEDPLLSGRMAAAITNGIQRHPGCGVTIKHFCANNQETNRYNNSSNVSERALRDIYLKAFEVCLSESRPMTVMSSYNLLNGKHTSESKELLEDVLRSEFGFDGFVMTDWVVEAMASDERDKYSSPVAYKVAQAGNDLFMPGSKREVENLKEALKKGTLDRAVLLKNNTRILRVMKKLGRLQ